MENIVIPDRTLKVEASLQKPKKSAEDLFGEMFWKRFRRPSLTRRFERSGFNEPEKAADIVAILEEGELAEPFYRRKSKEKKKYKFRPDDIHNIKTIIEDSGNSPDFIRQVLSVASEENKDFKLFVDLIHVAKENPQLLEKLYTLQKKIDLGGFTDLEFKHLAILKFQIIDSEKLEQIMKLVVKDKDNRSRNLCLKYFTAIAYNGCQDYEQLKSRVALANNPEFQSALYDLDLHSLLSSGIGNYEEACDRIACSGFNHPDDLLFLFRNKDKSEDRVREFYHKIGVRPVFDGNVVAFRELVEIENLPFERINTHLKEGERFTDEFMHKIILFQDKSDDEIMNLDEELTKCKLPRAFSPYISAESLKFITSMSPKEREDFLQQRHKLFYSSGISFSTEDQIIFTKKVMADSLLRERINSFKSERFDLIVRLIISKKDQANFLISDYIDEDGLVTDKFLRFFIESNDDTNVDTLLRTENKKRIGGENKDFWNFYCKFLSKEGCEDRSEWNKEDKSFIRDFLIEEYKKNNQSALFSNGELTKEFYQLLVEKKPNDFVTYATRRAYENLFGKENVVKFLRALPVETDEKRNAFTHNEYDRTSGFISYYLSNQDSEFKLDSRNFEAMTFFLQKFGLSKNSAIFRYYKNLYFTEKGWSQLPSDIVKSGVKSVSELDRQLSEIKTLVYGETPILDVSRFTSYQNKLLAVVTGLNSHRFGGHPLDQIERDFQADMTARRIAPLPESYKTEDLRLGKARIEFDASLIKQDYEAAKLEILTSIKEKGDTEPIKSKIKLIIYQKIQNCVDLITKNEKPEVIHGLEGDLKKFQKFTEMLDKATNVDDLMGLLIDKNINIGVEDEKKINSIQRQLVLQRVFEKHYSPGYIQDLRMKLESEISPDSILSIVNIFDNLVKTHALNLQNNNEEHYWRDDIFEKMVKAKRGGMLVKLFEPTLDRLKAEVSRFETIKMGNEDAIRMIPDRGLIGEMSAYLADVCYSAEYPLLKRWPNLIPHKFTFQNLETHEIEFIGSVLVFEVKDSTGAPCLLMRAFDVPKESQYDINLFIERVLDKLEISGKLRGKKRVLVPGDSGSISNYHRTVNHIYQQYVSGKQKISLKNKFVFNGHDLTNNCYVAREIKD